MVTQCCVTQNPAEATMTSLSKTCKTLTQIIMSNDAKSALHLVQTRSPDSLLPSRAPMHPLI